MRVGYSESLMTHLRSLVGGAGIALAALLGTPAASQRASFPLHVLEPPPLVVPVVCRLVKVDPSCWGDACRTRRLCTPEQYYRPGMPTRVDGIAAGRTSGAIGPLLHCFRDSFGR